jgi:hypothetical protein
LRGTAVPEHRNATRSISLREQRIDLLDPPQVVVFPLVHRWKNEQEDRTNNNP